MANNQRFTLSFDANLNVSQMKGAIGDIQKALNGLHLPQNATKGLTGTIEKITAEIQKFENAANKPIAEKADFSKLEKSAENIGILFDKLKKDIQGLGNLSSKDLKKLFPEQVSTNIKKATDAINTYKTAETKAARAVEEANKKVLNTQKELSKLQTKTIVSDTEFEKTKQAIEEQKDALSKLRDAHKAASEEAEKHKQRYKLSDDSTAKKYTELVKNVKNYATQIEEAQRKLKELQAIQKNQTTDAGKNAKEIDLTNRLNEQIQKLKEAQQILDQIQSGKTGGGLEKLKQELSQLTGLDLSNVKDLGSVIQTYLNKNLDELRARLSNISPVVQQSSGAFSRLREDMRAAGVSFADFDNRAREIESLKSRIQYFFGLNNAIQLVKRTITSAFNTIKELDKAMTETAVVTDFTVGDMWAQLPDYTKRANELGVTTKAAYEAATLYYQQGLKTNEVVAMSNETLKMARIAGLDAAVATDRMTNAIRGFNMEINEANAQRIDDVYSHLAAISASNVDEISTAMTKVASLANNANMEFETTAAFLAQIIETTRESAETAGTALKTVVARFSEVKKLVNEDQIKGQDEEGQLIDVNKVSEALRTAGIDLNKYFIGEVGLDDIFIELASKWDSLTSLQQRYIATQAAGSRQQSRFIALMQDYARTQELVNEAYNAEGASAKQFAKTQESLESKLARLKNAWNEFAMGIANSDLVKAGVDFLTLLLNTVNKLTDGFGLLTGNVGGFVSSLLKIGLLVGGLKAGKGLMFGGLSSLFGGDFKMAAASAMGVEAGKSTLGTLGRGFINPFIMTGSALKESPLGQYAAEARKNRRLYNTPAARMQRATGGNMSYIGSRTTFGVAGEKFISKGVGKNISTGLGKLFGIEGGLGGAATLATTIGGVATAAGVAYTIVKKLYDLSPAGQVKIAEKLVNALQSASKVAKENEKNLEDAQSVYTEKTATVNSAKNTIDYNKAILDRNEYISSLLEQDASYAKYIESVVNESGQFVLTFKEGTLEEATKEAEEATKNAAIQEFFAQGLLKNKESAFAQSEAARLKRLSASDNEEIQAQILRNTNKANQLQNESEVFTQTAFNKMLEDTNLPGTIAQGLSKVLADSFDMTEYSKEIQEGTGLISRIFSIKANKKKAFEEIYGKGSAEGLSEQELIEGINSKKATEKQQTKADDITNLFKGKTGQQLTKYTELLDAYNGAIDFNVQKLEDSDIQGVLSDFGKALGVDVAAIKARIRASQEQRKEIRTNNQANIFGTALQKGVNITKDLGLKITSLDFEDTEAFNSLLENLSGKVGDTVFQGLFEDIPGLLASNEFDAINKFAQSFDLDQPIAAFRALKEAEEQAVEGGILQSLVEDAKEVNAAVLDTGNLFQSFALSESYEEVAKSAADLIEENGHLTADNINELAGGCEDLATLLEIDTITAQGLANALTNLEMGNIALEGLTTNTLAAISAGQTYNDLLDEIHKTIEDFDPGIDTGEGSDFLIKQSEELTKLLDSWEFGNEQTKNLYNQLFANENTLIKNYKDFMEGWDEGDSGDFEQRAKARVEQLKGWAENNSYGFMREFADKDNGLGITSNGAYDFNWDLTQFQSTDEFIQKIADTAQVSTDTAKMLFEGFAAQSYSVQQAWDNLDYETKLKAFADSAGDATSFTQQELETLGKITGKTTDEVLQDFKQLREEGSQPIKMPVVVNWQDKDGKKLTGKALQKEWEKFMPKNVNSLGAPTVNYEQYAKESGFSSDKVKGGLNLDKIFADAANRGMNDSQAEEYANSFVQKINGALLTKTIKIPQLSEDNEIVIDEVEVKGETVEEVKAKIEAMQKEADYTIMGQKIAEAFGSADLSGINDKLLEAVQGFQNKIATAANGFSAGPISTSLGYAANNFASQLQTALNGKTFNLTLHASGALGGNVIKPHANNNNNNNGFHDTGGGMMGGLAVKGGKVHSYGSGSRSIAAGIALTGEEDPEIVWNKEQGYAYITGGHGPEFQNLQPGDRVFNANETKKILKRSKENRVFSSFGGGSRGSFKPEIVSGAGTGSSSKTSAKTSTNSEKTSDEWKNELDWLYNLMEDIAESERTQEKLATKHERYLKDATKTGKDLYNITKQQMQNLNQQYAYQKQALAGREKEMQEQINQSGYTDYVWWNNNDRTIEINWDKIEGLQDKDTYDKVSELVSKAEDIQSKIDAAEDALRDIEGQMGELQERYIQEYIDFEQRTLEAVVAKYQEGIDELSSLDDTLNKANDDILNSIRKEIDLQRQIRDNTDTENNINDMETRLAYLRRDTTGANQNEILQLEKQIREARQGYSDTLVDQSLDRLSEANEEASEQRQHQIELLTDQLEYWQKTGALWEEVDTLLKEAMGPSGRLDVESQLVKLIENAESFQGMSKTQQENFLKELEEAFKTIPAFQQMQEHPNYDNSKMYITDALSEIFEDGMIAWNSPQFQSYLKERNEKYVSEGWGTEEQAAIEMEALKTLAENYQGKTVSNSYQKSAYNSGADYKDLMNNLIKIYGSEATKRPEWAMASQARISKIVEEAVASGKGAAYVESEWQRALFEQEVLNQTAASKQPFNFGVDKKWIDDDPTNDGPDYRYEMLKIIANKGARALNDYDYLRYAGLREAKVVALGGSLDKARLAQAELNALATPEGQLLVKKALADGLTGTALSQRLNLRYKKGGLVTRTGPAWLDGTSREPEYVLNARQTDAFLRLAEVLPTALGRGSSLTNTIGGNVYLELTMNVGEIGSDYDVDRLVDRVKQDIYDASAYRNINVISSIR